MPADGLLTTIAVDGDDYHIVDLPAVAAANGRSIDTYPYVIRVLLENVARHHLAPPAVPVVSDTDVATVAAWDDNTGDMLPLHVSRIVLPDSSGIPALMDLAALRDVVADAAGPVASVEPMVPVDLIVDHSLQVDVAGRPDAVSLNLQREMARNAERYRFLKWAGQAFANVRVHVPGSGIIHQINLESLATVVGVDQRGDRRFLAPDFVIGGDSHTTMIGGIGVLGWGVGGIDAEAAMLGRPYLFPIPEVVGVRLTGRLRAGVTATDLVLTVTQRLRALDVVGSMVEFSGPGLDALSVPERATLANMAPEYGATTGFCPVDSDTIAYLERTRDLPGLADRVLAYCQRNRLLRTSGDPVPTYQRLVEFDLGSVGPSVAGPRRPQDRLDLAAVKHDFRSRLAAPLDDGGFLSVPRSGDGGLGAGPPTKPEDPAGSPAAPSSTPPRHELGDGSIVIAAITSCTNTSNPSVMLAAGLLARNARRRGLRPPAHVKTSLAPGSRAVAAYLGDAGLLDDLEALGFHLIGFGCTTCGGKSGPLPEEVAGPIEQGDLVAAAVLSGNRNFEGRIHRLVRANYIMSPPLVVAYALAGRVDVDLTTEAIGRDDDGRPVHLEDLWPDGDELASLEPLARRRSLYVEAYAAEHDGHARWADLDGAGGERFAWDPSSTYLLRPPFFDRLPAPPPETLAGARVLGLFGPSLTTDHVSPSGEIPVESPAGRHLRSLGVAPVDFNTYVSRRGNDEVMARATFANVRLKNQLTPGREGWHTLDPVDGGPVDVFDGAMRAAASGIPLIVIGGAQYGTGSSRDWAAKGPLLLGVRIVLAEGFERIHRANLIGVGIVPLLFPPGEGWPSLGLDGTERFRFDGLRSALADGGEVEVVATAADDGEVARFGARPDVLNATERELLLGGGMFATMLGDHTDRTDAPAEGFDERHPGRDSQNC